MKTAKKILSIFLVVLMISSTLVIVVSAASTTNIKVTQPRVGATPSKNYSLSNSIIYLVGLEWLEMAPGDSQYHYMSYGDEFKRGNYYRVYIVFQMNPNTTASPLTHPITINGNQPTNRSGFHIYYDFGKLGGISGGSGDSGSSGGSTACSHSGAYVINYKYTSYSTSEHLVSKYKTCQNCGATYLTDTYYESHNYSFEYKYTSSSTSEHLVSEYKTCKNCDASYITDTYYESHKYVTDRKYTSSSASEHLFSEYRKCEKCDASYLIDTYYESHKDKNFNNICDLCNCELGECKHFNTTASSWTYYDQTFHIETIHMKCIYCNTEKITNKTLPHMDADRNNVCDACNYGDLVLATSSSATPCSHTGNTLAYVNYEESYSTEHHRVVTHLKCTTCNKPYVSNILEEHHKDSDKNSICDICSLTINHQNHYGYNTDYECDFCGYVFQGRDLTKTVTIGYKEKVNIKAVANNLPEGTILALYQVTNNGETLLTTDSDGELEWTSDSLTEQTKYIVKVIDEDGNTLIDSSKTKSYLIVVDVKNSFFARLKALFSRNKITDIETYQFNY